MQLCKKQKNVQWIAGFLLAALAVSTTGAPVIVTEDDLLTDIPMVTSVTHMDQTLLQAPASVTIIDRETIQASTAVALIDFFPSKCCVNRFTTIFGCPDSGETRCRHAPPVCGCLSCASGVLRFRG